MSTDDQTPGTADSRDERVRALLEVEPLDDVTRRRLVRNALDAAAPGEPARRDGTPRWLAPAAAAAVVILAVGGVLVLVNNRGDDGGGGTAAESSADDATPPVPSTESELDAGDNAGDSAASAPEDAVPIPLGDLGAAPTAEALATRAERVYARGSTSPTVEAASPCLGQFEPALAVTTGTVDGASTTALIYDDRVLVVDSTTCAVVTEVAR